MNANLCGIRVAEMIGEQCGRRSVETSNTYAHPGYTADWGPNARAESVAAVATLLAQCLEEAGERVNPNAAIERAADILFSIFTEPRTVGVMVARAVDDAMSAGRGKAAGYDRH